MHALHTYPVTKSERIGTTRLALLMEHTSVAVTAGTVNAGLLLALSPGWDNSIAKLLPLLLLVGLLRGCRSFSGKCLWCTILHCDAVSSALALCTSVLLARHPPPVLTTGFNGGGGLPTTLS